MTWIYNDDLYNPKISDYINNSKEWATVSTVGLLDSFEIYLSYGKQEWEHILGLSPELEEPANYLTYELYDEKQGKFIFYVHLHVFFRTLQKSEFPMWKISLKLIHENICLLQFTVQLARFTSCKMV